MSKKTCVGCDASFHSCYDSGEETPKYCRNCGGAYRERAELSELENHRCRELLSQRACEDSQIRVELPSEENGYSFYITSYRPDDEVRICKELYTVMEMFVEKIKR